MLVGFDTFVEVVEPFGEFAQDLPFRRRLLVLHRLLSGLGHLCSPDGIYAEVFVEDHEKVVQPPLAKALVLELRVGSM